MAAGRASTLLIRILGDSTGATKALNQVAQAEAVVAEATIKSSKATVTASNVTTKALREEAEAAVRNAEAALVNNRSRMHTAQIALKNAKAVKADTTAHTQLIKALQLENKWLQENTEEAYQNAKAHGANAGATKKAGKSMAMFIGPAMAAAAAMVFVTRAASMQEQAIGGLTAVFGDQADEMLTWAESMQQYGFSVTEAATAATILGAQLKNLGIPMDVVVEKTQELIVLAGDLAATFGTDVTQALTAMTAAFRGEFEPLEKYGVGLSAAAVNAEILAMEQAGVTYETERQAKVVATYNIIIKQTADAQGQMGRETETLQQTMNRMTAATTNLAAELGGYLLPIFQPLVDALGDTIAKTGELIDEQGFLATTAGILTTALESIWTIVEPILIPALEALDAILQTITDFMNKYVVPAVEAVATAFDKIATAIENVIGWIQDLIGWIDDLWTHGAENDAAAAASASVAAFNRRIGGRAFQNSLSVNATTRAPIKPVINVTVQAGVGDPHAIAKEIRKVLQRDAVRMGRVA